ncbi:DUF2845 domain-containing protein [Pseudomonas typographi]|uniref:DUF2845 domain-containing protein n=1 Tax=Pseudomonas typographi TaxID=2715964 RepID=A0ABR7YVK6_9PSED|nr:DUF2845 domain-containing protein [Pseudomonas typographi]MBD1597205.1 DUF2845 domain-containing protein [Pseudomonas typographi]
MKRFPRVMATALMAVALPAHASMRCGTRLINGGDRLAEVIQVCGSPVAQASQGPAHKGNGSPRRGAQKTDVLVYGPNGGAYQYLLFVNEELIRVDLRRQAPTGDLLRW